MDEGAHVEYRLDANAELTEREKDCIDLMSNGYSDKEIGQALGIGARTVRFHIDNAKRKLKARTRPHAIANLLRKFIK